MNRRSHTTGIYALLIRVPRHQTVRVGRLGSVTFTPGVYVYVGSALNSLEGRISQHFRKSKRRHWHIDYLLGTNGITLTGVTTKLTAQRLECRMSREVQDRAPFSVRGFGCSDCNCDSHLHSFSNLQAASRTLSKAGFSPAPLSSI